MLTYLTSYLTSGAGVERGERNLSLDTLDDLAARLGVQSEALLPSSEKLHDLLSIGRRTHLRHADSLSRLHEQS